jgi:hypothetical protein
MGNIPYSYIMPHPFNNEYKDNDILEELLLYLVGLYEVPNILKYVDSTHMASNELVDKTHIGKP